MPAYNAAPYIAEAIESVLLQSFTDFELLIVDDGSTDETASIIRSFHDKRIVLLQQENKGVSASLNYGLENASADIIARFDADDICYPGRLEKQFHFISSNPGYIMVGSSAEYMDATGNYVFTHHPKGKTNLEIKNLPYHVCPFIHASVMYRKNAVWPGGYNLFAHSFEDHFLWHQLKEKGKMYNLPDALVRVRLNPGSLTMDESKRPAAFHAIKYRALKEGFISANDGEALLSIIASQDNKRTKESAYYSLLAKKYLWNNYHPKKARQHVRKAITLNNLDMKGYMLWLVSFLPRSIINNLHAVFGTAK